VKDDFQFDASGNYVGNGLVIVGGDAANFSQQNLTFDTTAATLRFDDPETINEPTLAEDPSQIFLSAPVFFERNLSNLLWPSLDVTDLSLAGQTALYLHNLSLLSGPEDDPTAFSDLVVGGSLLHVQDITTLDVRGAVIYLDGMLTQSANTLIWDSLNPGRSLSDIVRLISAGQFPSDDFGIGSLILNGADYVVLAAVPEPGTLIFIGTGVVLLVLRRWYWQRSVT
jgi:hypothetical protein